MLQPDGNFIRPRKNHNQWFGNIENHKMPKQTPIFNLRENDFMTSMTVPQGNYNDVKYSKKHNGDTKRSVGKTIIHQLENYCEKTTLHGLRYVGDSSLSLGERLFWFLSFSVAIGFAAYYITNIYEKWNSSPVIISFSPFDANIANIPFPAVTICNMNQAKKTEAERILREGTKTEKKLLNDYCNGNNSFDETTESSWEELQNFLVKVGQSCSDILKVCEWKSDKINCEDAFNNDLTDEGLCCSFNRLPPDKIFRNSKDIAVLNQTYPGKVLDWDPETGFAEADTGDEHTIPRRPLGAGTHLGLTLILDAQVDNYYCSSTRSVGFKMLLANPIETPKMADFGFLLSPGTEARITIVPSIREATDTLRSIDIEKRQCYFANERPLQYFRKYTTNNCKQECQAIFTYNRCNCVPYFLPRNSSMKVCNTRNSPCIENAKEDMELTTGKATSCHCLLACNRMTFDTSTSYGKLSENILSEEPIFQNMSSEYFVNNILIVHLSFEYTRYTEIVRRRLYDFTDMLASTGALLSVFLGFSFLSLMEFAYFLVWKVFFSTVNLRFKRTKKEITHTPSFIPFLK